MKYRGCRRAAIAANSQFYRLSAGAGFPREAKQVANPRRLLSERAPSVSKKFINRPVGWLILCKPDNSPRKSVPMYTQSLDIPGNVAPLESGATSPEQAQFDAVMAADGKIEPQDWMPDAYR